MNKFKLYALTLLAVCITCSCQKAVEINSPIDRITGKEIYKSNSGASSVVTGIYADMMVNSSFFKGTNSLEIITGLYSDELGLTSGRTDIVASLYKNNLTNSDGGYWKAYYSYIFRVNSALEGIKASEGLTPSIRNQLLGEAYFLRSFFYFYLVNLFGDVPMPLSTDIAINATLARKDKSEVYKQIIIDLISAKELLNDQYLSGDILTVSSNRLRPNKATANALLARVYLYVGDWTNAENVTNQLINGSGSYSLEPLSNVFKSASRETIWALQPVTQTGLEKTNSGTYIITAGLNSFVNPVYLSNEFYNSSGFEIGDGRKNSWTGIYTSGSTSLPFSYKYKDVSNGTSLAEFYVVFRLAEQYLIRAEARAQQGKLTGLGSASEDLNIIRQRAGLNPSSATTQTAILDAILKERRSELFTEWGHRFFDLKRFGKIDQVMSNYASQKGALWSPYKALFPIPVTEIQKDPNLRGHQNPGYLEN